MPVKQNAPYHRAISLANPAAGAEFTITGPGKGLWRVISVAFRLVTDATVAARVPILTGDDGTTVWLKTADNTSQAASLTVDYGAFAGAAAGSVAGVYTHFPLGDNGVILYPGWRLRSTTSALQAGDQYSNIGFLVEEFPNGPSMEWLPTVDRAEYERS